ncbi:hypothetical protein CCR96_02985 [Halochromatium roseum]|nr:hypothetical protein [Halochromatium roseum]
MLNEVTAGAGKTSLISLNPAAYERLYDRIHDAEIRYVPINLYVMRKFARLYLNDELTFIEVEQVAKESGSDPVLIFATFPKTAVIQAKYRQYHRDDRAVEHYTRIAQGAFPLYFGEGRDQ